MADKGTAAAPQRTYGQFCPLAAGMDVLGDRWVLLICRELLFGPRRFSELRRALPGIAPNLLASRLRRMQAEGVLRPSQSREPYELSEQVDEIRPVIRALVRFGMQYLDPDGPDAPTPEQYDAFYTARGFIGGWITQHARPQRARVYAPDGSTIDMVVSPGSYQLEDGEDAEPDVRLWTDVPAMVRLRNEGIPLPASRPTGEPTIVGDDEAVQTFLRSFGLAVGSTACA